METVLRMIPVLTGTLLFGVGLFAVLTRRRLDRLALGLYVAGIGVVLMAASLGRLGGSIWIGEHVGRAALAIALVTVVVLLALARMVATRVRATRTDDLEQLRG